MDKAKVKMIDLIKLNDYWWGFRMQKKKECLAKLKMLLNGKAVCDRAHQLGYKVAAHVESSEGVRVALEMVLIRLNMEQN